MVFLAEVLGSAVLFLLVTGICIFYPLHIATRFLQRVAYCFGWNTYLRQDEVRKGLGLPLGHNDSYYDIDIQFRRQRERAAGKG